MNLAQHHTFLVLKSKQKCFSKLLDEIIDILAVIYFSNLRMLVR